MSETEPTDRLPFHEVEIGHQIPFGPHTVSREEIIAFAKKFDPAPFHLSDEGADGTQFDRLSASGWHICSLTMKMMCEAYLIGSNSQGSPGVSECNWEHPVYAGDTLSGESTYLSKRVSKSRPGIGFVELLHTVRNQDGETVLTMKNTGIVRIEP